MNEGGLSSEQHESAAERARKKVLAVYSSTLESLKNNSTSSSQNPYITRQNGTEYIAPPVPGIVYSDQDDFDFLNDDSDVAGNDYEQVNFETTDSDRTPIAPTSTYTADGDYNTTPAINASAYAADENVSSMKDLPINQTAVNNEWEQYHSAWQNYYQNYYSEYYAKAAQNYLATEKLKSERIATGKVQTKRRIRRLLPVFVAVSALVVFLFLQYNRLFFAPIMAYVSPNTDTVASSIEAVNPTITQAVSPEPRLIIPKLNIDVPVAFSISTDEVMEAMNHGVAQFMIPGANALPGQIGNLVLSGHSAGDIYSSNPYKFIFSGLERLEDGDLIYVNYESVRYTYQMIRREVVEPTNVSALIYSAKKPMLTLITCTPLGTSRYRLLITAEQISPAFEYTEGDGNIDQGDYDNPNDDTEMPANEPSFLENIWSGLFGG